MKFSSFGLLFLLSVLKVNAIEVIRPVFKEKIILKIVRAIPDSFESYSLTNSNGREMMLVCAQNRVYDNNPKAFIEYRNFYNLIAGNFTIESNQICKDMAKFIESAHYGVDDNKPFIITLNTQKMTVDKIVYPKIDTMAQDGDEQDLLPKKDIRAFKKPDMNYVN